MLKNSVSSLSARRAWIEMIFPLFQLNLQRVALRKESVDRNIHHLSTYRHQGQSLSARRAWIEIECVGALGCLGFVALRKESVDRNDFEL